MNSVTWQKYKWPLIALALVLLFNAFFTPGFFNLEMKNGRLYGSLVDILNRAAPTMLLALGMTLVIATGGVDLSVGSVMAIAGAVAALFLSGKVDAFPVTSDIAAWATILKSIKWLLLEISHSIPLIVTASLIVALLLGILNGTLVGFFKITPIVATLILMVSGRGIAQLLTDGQIITFDNPKFEFIGRGTFLALPFTITLVLAVYLFLVVFSKRTAAGLFIESTGDNEKASQYAGVNTKFVKLLAYSICALLAGLAGLIVTTDIKAADSNNAGLWLELDAILATVIGGTALTGGRYFLGGSLIGAILIQALTTTILTRGVPVQWTLVVKAVVIILVCLLQSEAFRKSLASRFSRAPQTP